MLSGIEKSTYFTKLKVGRSFAVYAFGIYLSATSAVVCLKLIAGSSSLLTLLPTILVPTMDIVVLLTLAVTYKVAIEPLFHWIEDYISSGEINRKEQKAQDVNGNIVLNNKSSSKNISCRSSLDGNLSGKFHENLQTLVHQTNRGNYAYCLQQHDIAHIARVRYGYSENSTEGIFFSIYGSLGSLNKNLIEYKNKAKGIFTSIINLGSNHWVALVAVHNNKKFRAYYCDSFSADLPSPSTQREKIETNEMNLIYPLTKEASKLNAQEKKEIGEDVQKTSQICRKRENELINIPINTNNMVSALKTILGIVGNDMRSSKTKQQKDSCNCGIFALENAHKITQMLSRGKSFDEIDKELSEYQFSLKEKRREFTEALVNDEEWKQNLESGILCDLSPITSTSHPSISSSNSPVCNIT